MGQFDVFPLTRIKTKKSQSQVYVQRSWSPPMHVLSVCACAREVWECVGAWSPGKCRSACRVDVWVRVRWGCVWVCGCRGGSTNCSGGGGGSGQEFFKEGLGSSKRQVRGNFHTSKQKINTTSGWVLDGCSVLCGVLWVRARCVWLRGCVWGWVSVGVPLALQPHGAITSNWRIASSPPPLSSPPTVSLAGVRGSNPTQWDQFSQLAAETRWGGVRPPPPV